MGYGLLRDLKRIWTKQGNETVISLHLSSFTLKCTKIDKISLSLHYDKKSLQEKILPFPCLLCLCSRKSEQNIDISSNLRLLLYIISCYTSHKTTCISCFIISYSFFEDWHELFCFLISLLSIFPSKYQINNNDTASFSHKKRTK